MNLRRKFFNANGDIALSDGTGHGQIEIKNKLCNNSFYSMPLINMSYTKNSDVVQNFRNISSVWHSTSKSQQNLKKNV